MPPQHTEPQLVQQMPTVFEYDPGMYNGDYNAEGERHGMGDCTWRDGTTYKGEWTRNMRDGRGEYLRPNGEYYKGMWKNDLKNGEGEVRMPNGTIIRSTWENDLLHGHGVLIKDGNEEKYLWHYGLMIPEEESNSGCWDKSIFNLLLILITLSFLSVAVYFHIKDPYR